jgi:hypothetical protein
VTIVTNCEALHLRLQDLRIFAEQDRPFSDVFSVEVLKKDCRYMIMEGGETLIASDDAEWVTLYINELVNFHLAQQMRDYVKIHAACGSFNGKRFLLAGAKGAGKTTLITRCLFEGITVYGDEKVLVREQDVIPLPRKFHVKEGSVPLIPKLGPIWDNLTSYPTSHGPRVCFFDPTDAGCNWQARWEKVDTIFYLEPNHGKPTEVETPPQWLMAHRMMAQSLDFDENPEVQIADLCKTVIDSKAHIMRIGELDGAIEAMKEVLS